MCKSAKERNSKIIHCNQSKFPLKNEKNKKSPKKIAAFQQVQERERKVSRLWTKSENRYMTRYIFFHCYMNDCRQEQIRVRVLSFFPFLFPIQISPYLISLAISFFNWWKVTGPPLISLLFHNLNLIAVEKVKYNTKLLYTSLNQIVRIAPWRRTVWTELPPVQV